jgi:hypothetical protein
MKLNTTPRLQGDPSLIRELREHAQQVNGLAEGRIAATYNALSSVPTAGTYAQGDFVKNSAPTGSSPTIGWVCTVGGTPGTFVAVTVGGGGSGDVDTLNDVIVDNSAKGLVLKSPDAHYWRLTVDNAGALTTTDLGTVKP